MLMGFGNTGSAASVRGGLGMRPGMEIPRLGGEEAEFFMAKAFRLHEKSCPALLQRDSPWKTGKVKTERLTDDDAGIIGQHVSQFIPAVLRLELEHLEVNGSDAGRVFFKQFIHSFGQLFLVQRFRKFIHDAVAVMRNVQRVQERDEHVLVLAQQPDLEQVVADFIAGLPSQHLFNKGELFLEGLALDELRAQFLQGAEFAHGGAVNGTFLIAHPVQNVADGLLVCLLKNVICLHDG